MRYTCVILILLLASPTWADSLFDDASTEAQAAAAQSGQGGSGGLTLLDQNAGDNGVGQPTAQNAPSTPVWNMFADQSRQEATPQQLSGSMALPDANIPWPGDWYPYTQCRMAFGRSGQYGMSAFEKLDTVAANAGRDGMAAAWEGSDNRPWIAQKHNLPAGHNLALAQKQAGQSNVQWQNSDGSWTTWDVSWLGHCSGWSAAAVSFPANLLNPKNIPLSNNTLRMLRRDVFTDSGYDLDAIGFSGDLSSFYVTYAAPGALDVSTEDQKAILTELGDKIPASPIFTAGTRYDAPYMEFTQNFFDYTADGRVIVPADADFVGFNYNGTFYTLYTQRNGQKIYTPPQGYDMATWQAWMNYYEQQAKQQGTLAVWYANVPGEPSGITQLASLPPLVRRAYMDVDPLTMHSKLVAALGGSGSSRPHGLIAEISPGVEVWNFPVMGYSYQMSQLEDGTAYRSLFHLTTLDQYFHPNRLLVRVGQCSIRLQYVNAPKDKPYTFVAFYDENGYAMGSTWTGQSVTDHPDIIWYPDTDQGATPSRGNPYVRTVDVKTIIPNLPLKN